MSKDKEAEDIMNEILQLKEYQELMEIAIFCDNLKKALTAFASMYSMSYLQMISYLSFTKTERRFFVLQFKHNTDLLMATPFNIEEEIYFYNKGRSTSFENIFISAPKSIQSKLLFYLHHFKRKEMNK